MVEDQNENMDVGDNCANPDDVNSSGDRIPIYRGRRNAVHFASIEEFLASLNINDTALNSLQGVRTLSLEQYMRCMQGPDGQEDNRDDVSP